MVSVQVRRRFGSPDREVKATCLTMHCMGSSNVATNELSAANGRTIVLRRDYSSGRAAANVGIAEEAIHVGRGVASQD